VLLQLQFPALAVHQWPVYPRGTGDGGNAFTRSLKIWKFRESTVS